MCLLGYRKHFFTFCAHFRQHANFWSFFDGTKFRLKMGFNMGEGSWMMNRQINRCQSKYEVSIYPGNRLTFILRTRGKYSHVNRQFQEKTS